MLTLCFQNWTDLPDKQRSSRIKLDLRSVGPNRHLHNIHPIIVKHILPNGTWNILQDVSYDRTRNKSQETLKTKAV